MFIKSSSVEKIGSKNYLQVFLESKYPYELTIEKKGVVTKKDAFEWYFEEPTMEDFSALENLSVSIEKFNSYDSIKSIQTSSLFSKELLQEIAIYRLKQEPEQEISEDEAVEKLEIDKINSARIFIQSLFARTTDFKDYFQELRKFFDFIDSKSFRNYDGIMVNHSLSILDQYNATSRFIKEAIVVEYLAFFFTHFPSKSLHQNLL